MANYLLKTEPSEYSFADLTRDNQTPWTGVANAQALIHLRAMRKGDLVFIYHTGDEKAIVGLAKAISNPYEDPNQPGQTASGEAKFAVIDLAPVKSAKTPLTLASIKADKRFADFALVKQSRLSVMPVPEELAKLVRSLTGL
jgi:predicted RNA-binding protein with PUA-like domain